jgi:hypothetical protein
MMMAKMVLRQRISRRKSKTSNPRFSQVEILPKLNQEVPSIVTTFIFQNNNQEGEKR